MRILWPHNFDPKNESSGHFMHLAAQGMKELGVDVELLYLGNLRTLEGMYRANRMLSELSNQFDTIHSQYGSACALIVSKTKAKRKVVTLRGSDLTPISPSISFAWIHTKLAEFLTRTSLSKFDRIIAVSNRMRCVVSQLAPQIPCDVLPSPIDLNFFKPIKNKQIEKEKLDFANSQKKWILFTTLSTSNEVKNYKLACATIDYVNRVSSNKVMLRVATNLTRKQMPIFVGTCDVALCTSHSEGWPNSIKEALAANVPFVSTDVSDLIEIANNDSSCRVCPEDPVIIGNSILDVLDRPRLSELRHFVQPMSVEMVSARTHAIYQELMSN